MWSPAHQKPRAVLGLALTLATLHFVPDTLLVLAPLTVLWALLFYPFRPAELVMWVIAAMFFLVQNYVCLRAGLFEFRDKDILLMPYYEPLLWGFYFLSMKRFISGTAGNQAGFGWRSVAGLAATSTAFSLFSYDSDALFVATLCSTGLLLILFHTSRDLSYAMYALAMGVVVEIFGVSTGLWSYPEPDVLGIPYWFATMWMSVGLLGRRFLIPAAEWIAARSMLQRA